MKYEEALENLKQAAKELASIGDVKVYSKENNEDFKKKLLSVISYYNYICSNLDISNPHNPDFDKFIETQEIIDDIRYDNPSLEACIDYILFHDIKAQKENKEDFDKIGFANAIDSYVDELNNLQSWDEDKIEDMEFSFKKYHDELLKHKQDYNEQEFNYLMNNINSSLGKINKFNNMLESDTMQSFRHM